MSIPLAIVWHQHQPFYKDLQTGSLVMPWVRLHGIKDYYGMARLIENVPCMRCTINLVPSLVMQLMDYVENDAKDPVLTHTEMNADALEEKEAVYILDNFFNAQHAHMIRAYPRYAELLDVRRIGRRGAKNALTDFGVQDLRDLQVWFNLAWFHPISFEESEALRGLRKKGRDFTEKDKKVMLEEQRAVLAKVIPLHKKLAAEGQIELTTTPFYHPILPLLCDMESALEAMPGTPMPEGHLSIQEDAEVHVQKAVDYHKEIFGEAPVGMWPAEGSVSPLILPLLAKRGIQWIATDEGILSASLATGLRGAYGKIDRPDLLYRPWTVSHEDATLQAIFRDHELSDRIGFHYQSWDAQAAADDFLKRIRDGAKNAPAGPETIVPVILDGENCWEHFPDQGVSFLNKLYSRLASGKDGIRPVRVRDFLAEHPPTKRVDRLFSGSWINHDFYIWIGHTEDRKAWEYVFRVREDLVRETERRKDSPEHTEAIRKAWEELYIAEGSDWYWWYGDDRSSGNDEAFDELFRKHLKNVYQFLELDCPYFLDHPILSPEARGPYSKPHGVLRIKLDGRITSFFEWMGAGRYRTDKDGGVMATSGPPMVQQIYFGFDRDHLCLRIDLIGDNPARATESGLYGTFFESVDLLFVEPKGLALTVHGGSKLRVEQHGAWAEEFDEPVAAWDQLLELRIPFKAFGIRRGKEIAFYVEPKKVNGNTERFPRSYALTFQVPSEDIEEQDWFI